MKKVYLLIPFLLLVSNLVAQTNTTYQTTQEETLIEKQRLVPIKDCFLCTYGDVKRAFRFGYGNLNKCPSPNTKRFYFWS